MDYVYICRDGDNEELRYSLRSIDKNIQNANVWIVGGAPDWFSGNIIYNNEVRGTKYTRARSNLLSITGINDIADDFILMNDDFYIMKDLDGIPVWHNGPLYDLIIKRKKQSPGAPYNAMLENTYRSLRRMGIEEILGYELHVPMNMTKNGLREALKSDGLWRSIYGNTNNVGGEMHDDVKIYLDDNLLANKSLNIYETTFLSSMDDSFHSLKSLILDDEFPYKSKYER